MIILLESDGRTAKQLPEEKVREILSKTTKYSYKVDNVSSNIAIDQELVELLAVNKGIENEKLIELITKRFKDITCTETGAGLLIDGLINNNHQSVLNDMLYFRYQTSDRHPR